MTTRLCIRILLCAKLLTVSVSTRVGHSTLSDFNISICNHKLGACMASFFHAQIQCVASSAVLSQNCYQKVDIFVLSSFHRHIYNARLSNFLQSNQYYKKELVLLLFLMNSFYM